MRSRSVTRPAATFRAIVVALKAILLNLLSVAASYGAMVLVFQHGWLAGLLGGSLTLDSRVDVGTTATLRLPITQEFGEVTALGRVLVVDDDPTFRALARRMLGESARQIVEASDGATALRLLHDDPPDLLLLDLHIPPPDGRAVLAALRAEPDLAAVPVVVITAAEVDTADGDMNASAVVLQKSNLQPGLLAAAAAAAKRLIREKP